MAKQVVNTDRISASASKLRSVNTNIKNEFQTLRNKARLIESDWRGAAASAAQTTMYQIFKNSDVRSTVLQNYVNMLEQQVTPGYVSAENVNTKLADQFK